ncbi:MAG: hypothetical protein F6K40_25225 [Okeania sp. SIO3I5]|uniref:hypothetical protein n=1 Tax=Okeania sp. SIO3I5 TaxID=2607805 RepID=UPI0013B84836|nr:hypothetical protein [Okeania sp. SIO3I5]NEQ39375.1 hypothetical protein [Okeania sp. SIO3I5]
MLRKLTVLFMCLTLCWTTVACGSSNTTSYQNSNPNISSNRNRNQVTAGEYPVQQATYNDANGEYSLMLLNTPSGKPPIYSTTDLQMASLTDEEIQEGKSNYAEINGDRASLHIKPDFKIEYVHNVTETQTNAQTGARETVIVRRESNFWAPFAGAVAGQVVGGAISSMLFTPQYYVPPVYRSGGVMNGYGGYGTSYTQAVNRYQDRYQAPPVAVKNRQTLRSTGVTNSTRSTTNRKQQQNTNRSTGSGVGASDLRRSGTAKPRQQRRGFGSGGLSPSRRSSGFGGRRRR